LIVITADAANKKLNEKFTLTIKNNFAAATTVHAIVESCEYKYSGDVSEGDPYFIYQRCGGETPNWFVTGPRDPIQWLPSAEGPAIMPEDEVQIDMTAFIFARTQATGAALLTPTVQCTVKLCENACPQECDSDDS